MAEILFNFKIDEMNGFIFEVKYLNISDDEPKYLKYQWFILIKNELTKLKFIKMEGKTRTFENYFLDFENMNIIMNDINYKISQTNIKENEFLLETINNFI